MIWLYSSESTGWINPPKGWSPGHMSRAPVHQTGVPTCATFLFFSNSFQTFKTPGSQNNPCETKRDILTNETLSEWLVYFRNKLLFLFQSFPPNSTCSADVSGARDAGSAGAERSRSQHRSGSRAAAALQNTSHAKKKKYWAAWTAAALVFWSTSVSYRASAVFCQVIEDEGRELLI